MKIYEYQLIRLLDVLRDSLRISNMNFGGMERKDRKEFWENIMKQQDGLCEKEKEEKKQT